MNNIFSFLIEEMVKKIEKFIKESMQFAGFSNVVIGISGGVDSAVSATLAVNALGKEHVYAVLLPFGNTHASSLIHAKELIQKLQIPENHVYIITIEEAVKAVLSQTKEINDIRKGNIMARIRMIYLFDLAKKIPALVCGTENKSEHLLGYFTRFGDEASDIEPIRSLYKTQIWEMAKYLQIPETIITKAPTAGLWEEQTDEKELGFTYEEADIVLYYAFDQKLSEDQIVAKGITKELVQKVLKRVKENEFKHNLPKVFS